MRHATLLGLTIVAATLVAAAPAFAQPDDQQTGAAAAEQTGEADQMTEADKIDAPYQVGQLVDRPDQRRTLLPIGLGFSAGGGYAGFIDSDFNDFANPGGGWEARLLVGTDTWVGLEAAYTGSANDLDTLGLDDRAYLLGTGFSGALHLNLLPPYYDFRPYLLAGVGWKHYSLQDADANQSRLDDSDDLLEVPLAGGINYRYGWLLADLRVQFAPAFGNDLVRSPFDRDINLSTWRAVANIGFEL